MKLNILFLLLAVSLVTLITCEKDAVVNESAQQNKINTIGFLDSLPKSYVFTGETERDFPKIENLNPDRNGTYDTIFYPVSVSLDNWLMYTQQRTQTAFNKYILDSVIMVKVNGPAANINYVPHVSYKITLKFKNGKVLSFTDMSANIGNYIAYKVYGTNLLHSTNTSMWMTVKNISGGTIGYADWYYNRIKNKGAYDVFSDTGFVGTDQLNGGTPTGKQFLFNHN